METLQMKIAIASISKNEEQFVKRFCDSARDADAIYIADTGSADNTVEVAKECGAIVNEICISPWRFDHARNASLALVPKDIDIVIALDLDEVMEPGWREEIERVWIPGETTRLRYMFDWGCGVKFQYEKIFAKHGYYFWHPCHEYPRPDARINEIYAYTDKLLVSHHPDPTKSRGQYLDLLALSVKEDPVCPRNAFYYARELSFYSRWDESIEELKRYLALPGADWINERSYAMRTLGKCYEGKGDLAQAEAWWLRAAAESPDTREPWCGLATLYYTQARWQECYGAAMRALAIKDREFVYTVDPAVWGAHPHDLAAIAAWNLGMKNEAAKQGSLALDLEPENDRLKENLSWYLGEKG
jgi:glycosyltransferase involved in cell wall biosynthesis